MPARLLALACLAVTGCAACRTGDYYVAAVQASRTERIRMPQQAASPATRDATLAYWVSLKACCMNNVAGAEELRRKLGQSAQALRKLPVVGVDPELVEKVLVLAREMANMARITEYVHDECWPPLVPVPEPVMKEWLNTGSLLSQAGEAAAGMRPVLSQRYGIEFPAE